MKAGLVLALLALACCASIAEAQVLAPYPSSGRGGIITSGDVSLELEGFRSLPVYPGGILAVAKTPTAPAKELLPADAREMVDQFETESKAIRTKANQEICRLRQPLIRQLKPLQDKYTREGKLDEAVAIRDWIRALKEPLEPVLADPGALYQFTSRVGSSFFFRVTGAVGGTVWGTDVYTGDSNLAAAAAMHAGVLKAGESGVVKVTILPGRPAYQGSTRNGVSSQSYGSYSTSFKVESAEGQDCSCLDDDDQRPARSDKSRKKAGQGGRKAKGGK
jgi:hypothetical protein